MARRKPRPPGAGKRRPKEPRPHRSGRPETTVVRRHGREDGGGGDRYWIFGKHAVLAALANRGRKCHRLLVADRDDPDLATQISEAVARAALPRPAPESCPKADLEALLPAGAVHQGIALRVSPLRPQGVDVAWRDLGDGDPVRVVVLDQATDPRNIGAILRSAAAFGTRAVIVQSRHAPEETGVLAKAASGALETVPLVRATNLVRAMEELKEMGFWCVGLDGRAEQTLAETDMADKAVLVLGSEGSGLRRLVREACDLLARIPIAGTVESLNLSNAAAIALYELARGKS